jgi:alkylation response protein AidB-like acyl-CoA dehydrogenase
VTRTWRGPALDADHQDLVAMLDAFADDNPGNLEDGDQVAPLVARLADLGVWTLGTDEAHGGGGADPLMTAAAFERMGRYWPALAWAAVQAHVAVDLVGSDDPALQAALHAGDVAVAVVSTASPHVRLSRAAGGLAGTVDRADAAGPRPHLVVLDAGRTAYLVAPEAVESTRLERTGLGGAFTSRLEVRAGADQVRVLAERDVDRASSRLWCGAAAVAAGIAGGASDAAASYASGRQQFGDALTAIPTVRHSLLSQASGATLALSAAVAVDRTDLAQAYAVASAACDGAIDVAASALQAHGGYGYLTEYPAERYLRDAVSLRAAVDLPTAARTSGESLVGRRDHASRLATA